MKFSSANMHVQAKEAEAAGDTAAAIKIYKQAIKTNPLDDLAYNRLMVQLRRKKNYQEELKVIQGAIAAHVDQEHKNQQLWINKNKKLARTAKALVKSLGLTDRKGMPSVETKQLNIWRRRLAIVRKRIKQDG